jgi:hypothetical protein
MRWSSRTKFSRLAIDCFLSRLAQPVERTKIAELQASPAGGRREQVPGFGPSTCSRWVCRRNLLSRARLPGDCACNYQVFAVMNGDISSSSAMHTPRMSVSIAMGCMHEAGKRLGGNLRKTSYFSAAPINCCRCFGKARGYLA